MFLRLLLFHLDRLNGLDTFIVLLDLFFTLARFALVDGGSLFLGLALPGEKLKFLGLSEGFAAVFCLDFEFGFGSSLALQCANWLELEIKIFRAFGGACKSVRRKRAYF